MIREVRLWMKLSKLRLGRESCTLRPPGHARVLDDNDNNNNNNIGNMGIIGGDMIRKNLGAIKERLLEKLSAAAVPADALDSARRTLESVMRDVTVAAHALSKDAMHRIKTHLVEIFPFLSPALTAKMVDDPEKEAAAADHDSNNYDDKREETSNNQDSTTTANTIPILLNKPSSKL